MTKQDCLVAVSWLSVVVLFHGQKCKPDQLTVLVEALKQQPATTATTAATVATTTATTTAAIVVAVEKSLRLKN